jgi:hypothetical protein
MSENVGVKMSKRAGVVDRHVELPLDLDAAFQALCDRQGVSFSHGFRLAIARHIADPPDPATITAPRVRRPGRPKKSDRPA